MNNCDLPELLKLSVDNILEVMKNTQNIGLIIKKKTFIKHIKL